MKTQKLDIGADVYIAKPNFESIVVATAKIHDIYPADAEDLEDHKNLVLGQTMYMTYSGKIGIEFFIADDNDNLVDLYGSATRCFLTEREAKSYAEEFYNDFVSDTFAKLEQCVRLNKDLRNIGVDAWFPVQEIAAYHEHFTKIEDSLESQG